MGASNYDSEVLRQEMENRLNSQAAGLKRLLEINDARMPENRVPTLTSCVSDDGGFIVVNGSAHRMKEHFEKFFTQRPEFRQVVQEVLDNMFRIDMR